MLPPGRITKYCLNPEVLALLCVPIEGCVSIFGSKSAIKNRLKRQVQECLQATVQIEFGPSGLRIIIREANLSN